MKSSIIRVAITILAFISFSLHAADSNQTTEQGHEVHYNAISTMFLTPEVSKHYQIGRSKNKGFVNIAVLKQDEGKISKPVEADINISAQNFYGQNKEVTLRKVSENNGAIYYIGVFSVSSKEIIKFKAQIKPQNSEAIINIKFDKEFFTD